MRSVVPEQSGPYPSSHLDPNTSTATLTNTTHGGGLSASVSAVASVSSLGGEGGWDSSNTPSTSSRQNNTPSQEDVKPDVATMDCSTGEGPSGVKLNGSSSLPYTSSMSAPPPPVPLSPSRRFRLTFKLPHRAAHRLKRIANAQPSTLRRMGMSSVRVGTTEGVSLSERTILREAEQAEHRRLYPAVVFEPRPQRNPAQNSESSRPVVSTGGAMQTGPVYTQTPPNQDMGPPPQHRQPATNNNSPLLVNLLTTHQQQVQPTPATCYPPGTPGAPPTPGGTQPPPQGIAEAQNIQNLQQQQHAQIQAERHRMMLQAQAAAQNQVANTGGGTPGTPNTPGGYYNATTPGGPHSNPTQGMGQQTPQRPPSFGPGTPGPSGQAMFSPQHQQALQQQQQQLHQQQQIQMMQQQQMQQQQVLHQQQMQQRAVMQPMQGMQQMQQMGQQYRPPGYMQPQQQEEPTPAPTKKKRKPTKKQQKEAELAAQQQAAQAAAAHGSHGYYDNRMVHPAAMEGRPMPPSMQMMGGYPPSGSYPQGQHFAFPHGATPQQQHLWQMQQQQRQQMIYQQQAAASGQQWPPPHIRAPPVPYPQGSNPASGQQVGPRYPDAPIHTGDGPMNSLTYQQQQMMQQQQQAGMFRRDASGQVVGMYPSHPTSSQSLDGGHGTSHLPGHSLPGPSHTNTGMLDDSLDKLFAAGHDEDLGDLDDIEPMKPLADLNVLKTEVIGENSQHSRNTSTDPSSSSQSHQTSNGQDRIGNSSIDSVVEMSRANQPPISNAGPMTTTHSQPQPSQAMPPHMIQARHQMHRQMLGHPSSSHMNNQPIQQQLRATSTENGQRLINGHDQQSSSLPNGARRGASNTDGEDDAKIQDIVNKVMKVHSEQKAKEAQKASDSTKQSKARKRSRKADLSKEASPLKEEDEPFGMDQGRRPFQ